MNEPPNDHDRYIEVCDWESFQYSGSHKKTNPPWKWFRLHNSFIASPTWLAMTKPQRADFVTMLSLASRTGNMIPDDRKWLRLHDVSAKTLPRLEQMSLIRSFSLLPDDKRIRTLRSVYSGGAPPRGEQSREEEDKKEETREIPHGRSLEVRDSDILVVDVPTGHLLSGTELGCLSKKPKRKDPRSFEDLKLAVKPYIQIYGDDAALIHRFAGQSLKMSPKQVAACVRQLVADGEVTLPVRPLNPS